jgi:hypothetical protein
LPDHREKNVMRSLLLSLSVVAAIGLASPLAVALNPQPLPPGAHQPQPQPNAHVAALPTPAPVGACIKDEALRQQCTTMWNSCTTAKNGAAPICKSDWSLCCHHKKVRAW